MLLRNYFALFLLTASTTILADTVDINLRDNSVQLQYAASVGRDSLGTSELHAGLLYTDKNDRFGDFTVTYGSLLGNNEEKGSHVISPAWKPEGIRNVQVR